jgi:hypothetical protein
VTVVDDVVVVVLDVEVVVVLGCADVVGATVVEGIVVVVDGCVVDVTGVVVLDVATAIEVLVVAGTVSLAAPTDATVASADAPHSSTALARNHRRWRRRPVTIALPLAAEAKRNRAGGPENMNRVPRFGSLFAESRHRKRDTAVTSWPYRGRGLACPPAEV